MVLGFLWFEWWIWMLCFVISRATLIESLWFLSWWVEFVEIFCLVVICNFWMNSGFLVPIIWLWLILFIRVCLLALVRDILSSTHWIFVIFVPMGRALWYLHFGILFVVFGWLCRDWLEFPTPVVFLGSCYRAVWALALGVICVLLLWMTIAFWHHAKVPHFGPGSGPKTVGVAWFWVI